MKNSTISQNINIFHERQAPEEGLLVGYGALIDHYSLHVPIPDRLCIISKKHKRYETAEWLVFTPRHNPADTLTGHLTFAFKYEGIFPDVLKTLFESVPQKDIIEIIKMNLQAYTHVNYGLCTNGCWKKHLQCLIYKQVVLLIC